MINHCAWPHFSKNTRVSPGYEGRAQGRKPLLESRVTFNQVAVVRAAEPQRPSDKSEKQNGFFCFIWYHSKKIVFTGYFCRAKPS